MITNLGLVEFVKKAKDANAGYVYGTIGQVLTDKILEYKLKQYPRMITPYIDFIRTNYIGKVTYDCVNLIKAYIWQNDDKEGCYDPANDVSADGMFDIARVKGPIDTIPETPGICVRFNGHIGVYIGNGKVIEAKGTKYGVVETDLKGRGWTHWLECPYIVYLKVVKVGLKVGISGEIVRTLQGQLNLCGACLERDGSFGPMTEAAVKVFQKANGLPADGIVDIPTSQMLRYRTLESIDSLLDKVEKLEKKFE
ncbi:MAG: peptidoglycan-binding protein [Syntrophales bacterium]|nr:peptidoglycan-binding protein [Syntrophales bacterium]